jgi:ubiquinone/menaquinone biosynthesis C-methylase UbiE
VDGGEINYVKHDMTQPFTQFPDNSVDFIYIGQAIEHIHYFKQAPQLMQECFRMLRPGGIIRITTPDLSKLLTAYHTNNMEIFNAEQPNFYKALPRQAQLPLILFGASGDNCTQSHYEGHFFIYTEVTMTKLLKDAGFKDIEYTYPKRGKNKAIAEEIEDFGFSHSLIAEAIK